ncbi:C4-dicarboxylate transporter/malic acid transport protein [Gordonia westfalica]|uniref:C4-dicarboxylate transporter/malic acid transport protein n=2 Tax=Gordonia westfalica TaxID=158898 RepID=A0A1H2K4J3_9ACTN|nr:C4-dicarboxylate transporter/malic acid transport protein [Gordonia westfalica]
MIFVPIQRFGSYRPPGIHAIVVDMTTMTVRPTGVRVRPAYFPPNWFAAVMGTGIIAIAAHGLPWQPAGMSVVAVGFWLLACIVFVSVVAATAVHWMADPETARGHHAHHVVAHFYGAVPMAIMTVGTSTLVVGAGIVGRDLALGVDVVCWIVGTLGGVVTALVIPYQHLIVGRARVDDAFGGWLMPVVPPMVSASAAAILSGQLGAGWARDLVLGVGCVMFGLAVLAAAPILVALARRFRTGEHGAAHMMPTWWIVLGPLGQSVTAACLLAHVVPHAASAPVAGAVYEFAVAYGLVVWAVATLWIGVAARITLRTARAGMPFAMTWWSFTFPVGTYVTGSSALMLTLSWPVFEVAAIAGFSVLVAAWLVVAVRTARGVVSGELLRLPA